MYPSSLQKSYGQSLRLPLCRASALGPWWSLFRIQQYLPFSAEETSLSRPSRPVSGYFRREFVKGPSGTTVALGTNHNTRQNMSGHERSIGYVKWTDTENKET